MPTLAIQRLGLFASTFDRFPRFTRYTKCSIFKLPPDLLIDGIFPYLCIEDIMTLRRVCSSFQQYWN